METYICTCKVKDESEPFILAIMANSPLQVIDITIKVAKDSGYKPIKNSYCVSTLDYLLQNGVKIKTPVEVVYEDCDLRNKSM